MITIESPTERLLASAGVTDGSRLQRLEQEARESLAADPQSAAREALAIVEAAKAEGDEHALGRAMLLLSEACYEAGDSPEDVLRPVQFAIDLFTRLELRHDLAKARLLLSTLYLDQSDYSIAYDEAVEAARLADASSDEVLKALCHMRIATIALRGDLGDPADARRELNAAAEVLVAHGDIRSATHALYNLAVSSLETDPRAAASLAARGLITDGGRSPRMSMHFHVLAARAATRLRWLDLADAELAEAERLSEELKMPPGEKLDLMFLAASLWQAHGNLIGAQVAVERTIHAAREMNDDFHVMAGFGMLSEILEAQGDVAGALAASRAEAETVRRIGLEDQQRRQRLHEARGRLATGAAAR